MRCVVVAVECSISVCAHTTRLPSEKACPAHTGEGLSSRFATQYNCGSDDVLYLNRTDVYWSDYYVTSGRLQEGSMTIPMLSDFGLALILRTAETDTWASALTMVRILSGPTWLVVIATVSITHCAGSTSACGLMGNGVIRTGRWRTGSRRC